MRLKRAKPPELPDSQSVGTGSWPPWGVGSGGLDWLWAAIDAGMWGGAPINLSGVGPILEAEVLALPGVAAALSLIASYAVQMPLEAVSEADDPPSVIEPTPAILRCPTGDPRATNHTLADWVESLIRDLALWGDYLGVLGDAGWDGWPRLIYPVPAWAWSVRYDSELGTRYTIGDIEYDPAEVFHVAINRNTGELRGRGLLSTHRGPVEAAIMAERWAGRYFQYGATPSVHIKHPNPDLTQPQAEDLKQKYLDAVAGSRKPVVTPVGTEIDVIPNDAESAQLVEARKWSNAALAIALGVQPAMIGLEGPSMTYRNMNDVAQMMVNTTEMRYLIPVEQQLSAQCLPRGIKARFSIAALVRPDWNTRMDQAIAGFAGGILTNAEARSMLDLPPEPELEDTGDTGPSTDTTEPAPSDTESAAIGLTALPSLSGAPITAAGGN